MTRLYRIHPGIGVARVGDSPDEFFVGPEAPGVSPSLNRPDTPQAPDASYKVGGRIKRQGARFRIYEYAVLEGETRTHVREITAAEATIEWEVHLVNRKAAANKFSLPGKRNAEVPADERHKLVIDAGPQRISGRSQKMKSLSGSFSIKTATLDVGLGDLLTDTAGRLIVLGGLGKSQSLPGAQDINRDKPGAFANNDGWCDDVSDGPVRATIRLNDAAEAIEADPAWVIVAPPDFAPPIENVVTLYDVVYDRMAKLDPSLAVSETTKVSFTQDIYPILRRVSNMHWVSDFAQPHGPLNRRGHFLSSLPQLASKSKDQANLRARGRIFDRVKNPTNPDEGDMPALPGGDLPMTLTEVQYERMKRWADGDFEADWPGEAPPRRTLDQLAESERPAALDRAALEGCVGGGFFPGIEVSRIMRGLSPRKFPYEKERPFRINQQLPPGTLTEGMAVPWQADFHDCAVEGSSGDWWPGQRPNQVFKGQTRIEWMPPGWSRSDMLENWSKLGFVVKDRTSPADRYVEEERDPSLPVDPPGTES